MADVRSKAERVFTNYLCYKIDPLWRRLPASERQLGGKEFRAAIHEASGRVAVRSYLTTGFREDIDFFLWVLSKEPDPIQELAVNIYHSWPRQVPAHDHFLFRSDARIAVRQGSPARAHAGGGRLQIPGRLPLHQISRMVFNVV